MMTNGIESFESGELLDGLIDGGVKIAKAEISLLECLFYSVLYPVPQQETPNSSQSDSDGETQRFPSVYIVGQVGDSRIQ